MNGYRPLGPLGFGGASLGNMYAPVDDETAEATLAAVWDTGVRCFDTAPGYGLGLAEHRFGNFLRRRPRQDFMLATKVGRLVRTQVDPTKQTVHGQGPGASESLIFKEGLPFHIEVDYGYDAAMRSVEDSCQRLGISEIDIVFVHDLGSDHLGDAWEQQFDVALNGCFRALAELRDQGVIKAWGLGNNVVEPGIRALKEADPDVIQIAGRYTLLEQSALDELFPLCAARDVPVMLGGVYNSDILAGGNHYDYAQAAPDVIAKRDRIQRICAGHGVDIRAAALQFGAAHPVVSTVLAGAKYPQKARENAEFMSAPVPSELWQELRSEGILPEDAPVPA
ncbi:aldo/keto reductase (plasmid) [Streptomyces sp. N50]|nr:aldo/keto reductase [Streptomyces sp. N50]WOX16948.1 aldo/keto reductase [Streptomyces sp. N50]